MDTKIAAFQAARRSIIDYTKLVTISKVSMDKINNFSNIFTQRIDNIPQELLQQPRWVNKINGYLENNWNSLGVQHMYNSHNGKNFFDISSHSVEHEDYLLMDWDNVYDPENHKWVCELAEQVFYWTLISLPITYVEMSTSKQGFHILLKPTPCGVEKITNSLGNRK